MELVYTNQLDGFEPGKRYRVDDANIQYRANASKESLEKLVAELTKE